jgi:hypothetical protein
MHAVIALSSLASVVVYASAAKRYCRAFEVVNYWNHFSPTFPANLKTFYALISTINAFCFCHDFDSSLRFY